MDQHHPTVKRIHFYILILTGVLFLVVAVLLLSPQTNLLNLGKPQTAPKAEETSLNQKGTVKLQETSNLRTVTVGQPLTVQIIADSEEEDVVGFDVLLEFDQDAFTLTTASSPLTGYQVSRKDQVGHVSLTGYQLPQSEARSNFEGVPILELTFTPKAKGTFTFSISQIINNETTKFVNTDTEQVFPATTDGEFSIEVN